MTAAPAGPLPSGGGRVLPQVTQPCPNSLAYRHSAANG